MNKPVAQLELVVTAAKVDTKPIDSADGVITSVEPAKKKCALTVPASAESADLPPDDRADRCGEGGADV